MTFDSRGYGVQGREMDLFKFEFNIVDNFRCKINNFTEKSFK